MNTILPTPDERQFALQHLNEEVTALALRLRRFPSLDAARVLRQVKGYQVLRQKVPSWAEHNNLSFADSLPLEQCSSEVAARYKAALVDGIEGIHRVADLTGGLGVDFSFLAAGRREALYVERRDDLCTAAAHNFKELNLLQAVVINADGPSFLAGTDRTFDLIFLDPARRNAAGGKVVALSDCEPDVSALRTVLLARSRYVMVKLSPMLDIAQALRDLPETVEVHVVSVDNECKELLFLLSSSETSCESAQSALSAEPRITCVHLHKNAPEERFSFDRLEEASAECRLIEADWLEDALKQGEVQGGFYLYEPNPSLLKAGAFAVPTQRWNVRKLHPNSHLYVSPECLSNFPGRRFVVDSVMPWHPKHFKKVVSELKRANLTVRNFPETVAGIRKKTGLREGGDVYFFATTLSANRLVLFKAHKA